MQLPTDVVVRELERRLQMLQRWSVSELAAMPDHAQEADTVDDSPITVATSCRVLPEHVVEIVVRILPPKIHGRAGGGALAAAGFRKKQDGDLDRIPEAELREYL